MAGKTPLLGTYFSISNPDHGNVKFQIHNDLVKAKHGRFTRLIRLDRRQRLALIPYEVFGETSEPSVGAMEITPGELPTRLRRYREYRVVYNQ
nr:hypothetical protein [Nitrosomonas nitrosa]